MTSVAEPLSAYEYAARMFEPRTRKWGTPGDLARDLDPAYRSSPAHALLDAALVSLVERSDFNALAVFMPVQEGKSQKVSRRFAEWLLQHDPALRIAIISYEQEMAIRWGREIKRDIVQEPELDISIRADSTAAGRWDTPEGGGVYCVGIGGPLTGRPVDVLIIDDPVKDRAAAESEAIRNSTWDWWESVAVTRLAPGGKVVLIQTRWHEDDLAGRLQSRPSPLKWKVITIPAIAEEGDVLGRQPGEELVSVRRRDPGHFANIRANTSPYVWSGIYQQHPSPAEGGLFRRAAFRYWREMKPWPGDMRERIDLEGRTVTLDDCWRFAVADLAVSTRTSADYTVIGAFGMSLDGDLILLDRVRTRVDEADHFAAAAPLLTRWRIDQLYVEHQYIAKTLVVDAQQAGYPVVPLTADADKLTRAIPAAGRVHAGRCWFPADMGVTVDGRSELDILCDELAGFPKAEHDDQVDMLAYAARVAAAHWLRPVDQVQEPVAVARAQEMIEAAHVAATGQGNGHGTWNPMDIPF